MILCDQYKASNTLCSLKTPPTWIGKESYYWKGGVFVFLVSLSSVLAHGGGNWHQHFSAVFTGAGRSAGTGGSTSLRSSLLTPPQTKMANPMGENLTCTKPRFPNGQGLSSAEQNQFSAFPSPERSLSQGAGSDSATLWLEQWGSSVPYRRLLSEPGLALHTQPLSQIHWLSRSQGLAVMGVGGLTRPQPRCLAFRIPEPVPYSAPFVWVPTSDKWGES